MKSEASNTTGSSEWAEHRIKGRSVAMPPAAPSQRLFQNRSGHLEIDSLPIEMQLVAEIARPLQSLLDIERPD